MNRSCKERRKINRNSVEPYEYTGLKSQENSKSKPRERRRSNVIDKVKEISGLETFDKPLNGNFLHAPSGPSKTVQPWSSRMAHPRSPRLRHSKT